MVFFAGTFPPVKPDPGALLTELPAHAASSDKTKTVAMAEKTKLVAESANVRAGRIKLFMGYGVSSGFGNLTTSGGTPGRDKLAGSNRIV